ncbi:response regulator transcription factor [soil metagenome]
MTITVAIVDDHAVFRAGLRAVLHGADEIEVIADAGEADNILAMDPLPDVVLMDLDLPGTDGATATRRLTERHPGTRVLVLSMHDDAPNVLAAVAAGASGYVTKSADLADIVRAIHAVHSGQFLMGGDVAAHLVAHDLAKPDGFTLRERQLLPLLADGVSTERMSSRLGVAEKTVRNYLSNLYPKLGAYDRTSAAIAARKYLSSA